MDWFLYDNGLHYERVKSFMFRETWNYCDELSITWNFILENPAKRGGFYERVIGIVKPGLRKIDGSAKLRFDELNKVLVQIVNMLNTRLLT